MTDERVVHVAVYDTLADWEVGYLIAHVNSPRWQRQPGRYRVVTVGESAAPVTTIGGWCVVPDTTVDDVQPRGSAMLVLPGADTWVTGGNQAFVDLARRFEAVGVPVAAICGATAGLARAGLLDDRFHTSNAPEFLAATGYRGVDRYRDVPVVNDRGVITATATAPVDFAREAFAALDLYEPATLAAWYKLYGQGDPAGYHELVGQASS